MQDGKYQRCGIWWNELRQLLRTEHSVAVVNALAQTVYTHFVACGATQIASFMNGAELIGENYIEHLQFHRYHLKTSSVSCRQLLELGRSVLIC